jgi:hypothetical protein
MHRPSSEELPLNPLFQAYNVLVHDLPQSDYLRILRACLRVWAFRDGSRGHKEEA